MREQGFQRGSHVYEKNVCNAKLVNATIKGYPTENQEIVTNISSYGGIEGYPMNNQENGKNIFSYLTEGYQKESKLNVRNIFLFNVFLY